MKTNYASLLAVAVLLIDTCASAIDTHTSTVLFVPFPVFVPVPVEQVAHSTPNTQVTPQVPLQKQNPQQPDFNTYDVNGLKPIHKACMAGDAAAVAFFIAHGASVEELCEYEGKTPLYYASQYNRPDVVKLLLEEYKANPDAQANKSAYFRTPLHTAALKGHTEVAALLLKHKADIEARTAAFRTPLHCATEFDRVDTLKLLLESNANPCAQDDSHNTPIAFARNSPAALLISGVLIRSITQN